MNAAATQIGNAPGASAPKTLVYGLGNTGLSVARYLVRRGEQALYLDSRKEPPGLPALKSLLPDAQVVVGRLPDTCLDQLERAIVSPGIAESDAELERLRRQGIDIVSDIELFVDAAPAGFVAVTGSNGKSTVTTLIAEMCEAAGVSVLAGGNLGRPALDLLDDDVPDVYVLELSSFQLQRTRRLPARVSVLLNIAADHLDWHRSADEYRAAKYRIFDQAGSAVINRGDSELPGRLAAGTRTISFGTDAPGAGQYGIVIANGREFLARGQELLLAVDEIAMTGRHNYANALAALAAGELAGLRVAPMLTVLRTFRGLPHRMNFIRDLGGVHYINDSKATNVAAATAAVQSIDGPVVLLAGGQGKGGDFAALAGEIAQRLRAIIVFGEDAPGLEAAFAGRTPVTRAENLAEAVSLARRVAVPGDTVLLAPACASFDQFSNYQHRGDTFRDLVTGMSE